MYAILPLKPARNQSRKCASSRARSMFATPSRANPSSSLQRRKSASRAGASRAVTGDAEGFMRLRLRGLQRGYPGGPYNGWQIREPLRQWTSMPRITVDFDLPDSNATEALGQALA